MLVNRIPITVVITIYNSNTTTYTTYQCDAITDATYNTIICLTNSPEQYS